MSILWQYVKVLNGYLAEIDQKVQDNTEQLKAENTLEWVGRLNNIRTCAIKIIEIVQKTTDR